MVAEIESPEVHRLSLDEYHRLIESGGFDEDARIELIDGLLLDMSPRTPEHERRDRRGSTAGLQLSIDHERFEVRSRPPLTLETSEPEPDLMVVERRRSRVLTTSRTAALVIEVSVSSLRRDLRREAAHLARAGVPVYWVIDMDGRAPRSHSEPGRDGYAARRDLRRRREL